MGDPLRARPVRAPRDPWLLLAALVSLACWLLAVGLVRMRTRGADVLVRWLTGSAPSFFAGLMFASWQAFIVRTPPYAATMLASALVVMIEVVQLFLPGYTADPWDAVAGVLGAALALPFLLWRARRVA